MARSAGPTACRALSESKDASLRIGRSTTLAHTKTTCNPQNSGTLAGHRDPLPGLSTLVTLAPKAARAKTT